MSVDPAVASTNHPYLFTNDNPLNATDPLGLGKLIKLRLVVKAYSVPVGVLGVITIKNVHGKIAIDTPFSKSMISLQFNSKTTTYANGISAFNPVYLSSAPRSRFTATVDGHHVEEATFVLYASVFGGDYSPGEFDPGIERVIPPSPAETAISYQKSVTFEVVYYTPVRK